MSVTVAINNSCSTIGEGPHWNPKTRCLLYVDINAGDVHSWDSTTDVDTKVHLDGTVGFVVPRKAGGFVVGLNRTISFLDWDTGSVSTIVEVEQGTKNRFNDAKCDPNGRLWAGTMGHETHPGQPEPHMGHLYCLHSDRNLHKHLDQIDISNGLAWSSDGSTVYYIDSKPRHVYAFDWDGSKGTITNQRVAIDFSKYPVEEVGYPDGMCIDNEDKLWIAGFFSSKVVRFDPVTGELLQAVKLPASNITSCCFGGPNMDELYVTCSRYGLNDEQSKQQPLAGSVFKVTGLGVKGIPHPEYEG